MKTTRILTIMVFVLGLVPAVHGAQSLTVNGLEVEAVTVRQGQVCTVEVVSDNGSPYSAYVGFDDQLVLGSFAHTETRAEAGDLANVSAYSVPAFEGYFVTAAGSSPPPSAGVHFVFAYNPSTLGDTTLKLYDSTMTNVLDSVQITVLSSAMGTSITYQGRLIDNNDVADGLYDLRFELYDAPWDGNQIGSTVEANDLDIVDGYFTMELDFGPVYDGNAMWLGIEVRAGEVNDPNGYTMLSPRQRVMPTPYAIYAETAGGMPGGISGSGTANYIAKFTGSDTLSDSAIYEEAGNVGIGTTSPISRLEVMATENQHGIRSTVPYIAVYGHRTGTSGTWPGIHGECDSLSDNASGVRGVITSTSPGTNSAGVRGINNGTGATGIGVWGYHDGSGYGVYGHTAGDGIGVYGVSSSNYGVYSVSDSNYGVYGVSRTSYGVHGYNSHNGNYGSLGGIGRGVLGYGNVMGVYGYSDSGAAVRGDTATGYAGYFLGDVKVTGKLTKGSGSFKIDHPLDPENKYLEHSFVESPDMMNVYNGNVTLDKNGEACVRLPEYFEALNGDFRYQLTAIGVPAPNLYIAEEISNNRFKIAGGKRGMKVSWQVTGIRQDPYAVANRIVVEEDKPEYARGYYLQPEVYGQPKDRNIENAPKPQLEEQQVIAKEVQQ